MEYGVHLIHYPHFLPFSQSPSVATRLWHGPASGPLARLLLFLRHGWHVALFAAPFPHFRLSSNLYTYFGNSYRLSVQVIADRAAAGLLLLHRRDRCAGQTAHCVKLNSAKHNPYSMTPRLYMSIWHYYKGRYSPHASIRTWYSVLFVKKHIIHAALSGPFDVTSPALPALPAQVVCCLAARHRRLPNLHMTTRFICPLLGHGPCTHLSCTCAIH